MLSIFIRSKILTSTCTSLKESDIKKVVNQHSDTNNIMLIVEKNNLSF